MKTLLAVAVCLAMMSLAGTCFAQTQLVSDNFDAGINGTYLGSNWTGCSNTVAGAASKLVYENSQAGGSGYYSQDCALYTGYGAFPSDQYATAIVVAPTPSSSPESSIELRGNATFFTPESYIACGWNAQDFAADYHYRIWSLAPGGQPASLYLSRVTPATNDVVWCQVLGTTVTMQVNGTTIATVTDTSGITSGDPGLYYIDLNGGAPPSNDVVFDNFAAGSGPALVSIAITPSSATVTAGSYVQFTAIATYANGSTSPISNWSSSGTSVATIDTTGLAYAASPGTVTITAASGADSGTVNLTVVAAEGYTPLVNDSFNGGANDVYLGSNWTGCSNTVAGAASKLVYENSQAGGSGYYSQDCALYTGYGAFPSDQYATAIVVAPTPSSSPESSIELRGNATFFTPESYIACGWNAQDFAADYHYRIWSLAPGGQPASLYLSRVTPATNDVVWCQVLGTTVTMQVNGTTIAVVADTSGITSGDPGLYYIDLNGGAPPPTDVIFDNFVAGRIDRPVLASIAITPSSATVMAGSYVQFTATGTYTDGSTANVSNLVSWSSSNTSIATVNTTGLAYAASPGTVTITAASGTATGTASLTVQKLTPTVTFTGAPANAPYNGTFTVTATTNAPVMPTITGTTGVCSVGTVTGTPASASAGVTMLTGTGTCAVTANWAATTNYYAAGPLPQRTTAVKAASTITITSNTPNPSTLLQAVAISFTAAGAGAGPTGYSVTVTASTRESCTGTLTSAHTGTCSIIFSTGGSRTLTASYAGDRNFNGSTSASVSQTVNSPTVSLSLSSISFGGVTLGTSSTQAETVTNTGTGALINFSWSITGPNANRYSVSSTTCGTTPATLNPGASCVINVTFRPNNTGTQTASLRLTDNATNSPQTVGLSGTGQ